MLATIPSLAFAIVVEPSGDAFGLANTLFINVPGLTVQSANLQGYHDPVGPSQSGAFTNLDGTYGLPVSGIVLSSGNVSDYASGPNTENGFTTAYGVSATAEQEALLQPITGQSQHFDVVQLDIEFVPLATSSVTFFATFGSEEFPEFVGSSFIDGFGLYVNGVNVAGVLQSGGSPGDPLDAVNINHPDMDFVEGTELTGVLAPNGNPVLRFDVPVISGEVNNFQIILADASDEVLDTTVYLSSFIPTPGGGGGGTGGETEFNPLLPSNPPDPVTGTFEIVLPDTLDDGEVIWIDPPVSVGYVYEIDGAALFASIIAPSLATVADLSGYTVTVGGSTISLAAGASLDFSDWLGFEPDSFVLSGIDPLLGLDPGDTTAFPVGVALSGVSGTTKILITPVTEDVGPAPVPLPAGLGLYLVGLAGIGVVAARRRRQA